MGSKHAPSNQSRDGESPNAFGQSRISFVKEDPDRISRLSFVSETGPSLAKKRDSVGSNGSGVERSRDVIAYRNSVISPRGQLTSKSGKDQVTNKSGKGLDPNF
jgi:hypothetical protein